MIIRFFSVIISLLASIPATVIGLVYFFTDKVVFSELIIALAASSIMIFFLRLLFHDERPNPHSRIKRIFNDRIPGRKLREFYESLERRSIASGHVSRCAVFLGILYLNAFSVPVLITFAILTLLVAFARVYLRRHRFIDVVIGGVIGLGGAYFAGYAYNFFF